MPEMGFVSKENHRFAHSLHRKINHSLHMVCTWFSSQNSGQRTALNEHAQTDRTARQHASGPAPGSELARPGARGLRKHFACHGCHHHARNESSCEESVPSSRYCIEECLPNCPLFSCSTSHRSALQPSEHRCSQVCTTLGRHRSG